MIDLFHIRAYLEFLMRSYPEIKIHLEYNPYGLYCNLSIRCDKAYSWYFGTIPAENDDFVISRIDIAFQAFLCNDKVKEVLCHGKTRPLGDMP